MKHNRKRILQGLILVLAAVLMRNVCTPGVNAASKKNTAGTDKPVITIRINSTDVTKKNYSMQKGSRSGMQVSSTGLTGKKQIQYTSSDKKIVSVTKNGTLKAKKAGTAKISVSVLAGKKKLSTWVKIKVTEKTAAAEDTQKKEQRILTVYFSGTGTTEKLAEYAAEYLHADLYEIVPQIPYTDEDLAYYTDGRADREQNDPSARPAIAGRAEQMEQYDTIVLGYPIWHGQAPRIISTFLESYDFSGKTILPFCTSHSSGIGSSAENLHSLTDSSTVWKSGSRFSSETGREEIEQWLQKEGILPLQTARVPVFNFETKTVTLNSGYEMPVYGIGTYSLTDEVCVNSITAALNSGVRLIDTAYMYHNEESVGEAVRNSGIPREEIFIITKLYPNQYADPQAAIDEALEKLGTGYIDMMLLHHPGEGDVKAYLAMEKAAADGKIRSIGLSNWYVEELEEFLPQVTVTPALVQNEIHPYYQENDVIPYIQSLGIAVQGWYPLGGRGHTAELLGDEVISEIARAHGVSSAQVILRWNLQKGVVVIPGSSNPEHIQENTQLFHFELTEDEMERIRALDRNEKHDWY